VRSLASGFRFLTSEATTSNIKATHGNQATAEALAQQIAQLNVEEVLQGERFMQNAPQMIRLREQKSKLEQRLTQLQPCAYQTSMAVATARAIEAQIADLEVQYATDNIDDTLSKANANGGKTLYPKHRSETWAGLPSLKIAKAIALPYIPSQYCLPSDPGRWIKSLGKRWCYAGSPTHGAA